MDIQVNKHQLDRVVIKWLNNYFGNLTPKKHKRYPNSVFYVNPSNEVMMEYDKETECVWVHFDQIWSKVESIFHLNLSEIRAIMSDWLEGTYKLEGVKPKLWNWGVDSYWNRSINWGD